MILGKTDDRRSALWIFRWEGDASGALPRALGAGAAVGQSI